jgi:cobalt/nickel transport system permease protein
MKHSFIDEYSGLDSFVHRLDPRSKLLGSLAFILLVVITPVGNWRLLAAYFIAVAGWVLLSRVPPFYVLKRSLVIFPFVVMIAIFMPFFKQGQAVAGWDIGAWHIQVTYEGLVVFLNVVVKSWICILCLIILSSSTKFEQILRGMYSLKVPGVFVHITSFMYRYVFVLADQAMRMQMARDSRNFGMKRSNTFKTMGGMIGILFIRSYERGERIYAAMLSRGYTRDIFEMSKLQFRAPDAYFALAISLVLVCPAVLWWK